MVKKYGIENMVNKGASYPAGNDKLLILQPHFDHCRRWDLGMLCFVS